ncbi:MAG: response regulator [Dethiobacteria bacterium]|jgi:pilus assembly protein CpaE
MERIKVLVVVDDPEKRSAIAGTLSNVEFIKLEGEAGSADEALEMVETKNPDVMLIDALLPGDGYKLAEKLSLSHSWISIIMIENEINEKAMHKTIIAGAKDVIVYPFPPAKLVDAIHRSFKLGQKKSELQREKKLSEEKDTRRGKVITVFSTKGGVGKTFFSTNLAVSLAKFKGNKVALLDLDLDFGSISLALNLLPRYTIADVVNDIRNLDSDLLDGYLTEHQSGVKVLAANVQPQMTNFISADHVEVIIKILREVHDYVVIDLPVSAGDSMNPAFQEADLLMLVTTQDLAAIRNTRACMVSLNSINYPRYKIRLLLNKAEPRGEIKSKDVETTLEQSLYGLLPAEHRLVSSSLNKGVPVVLLKPRARISRSIQRIARKILENGVAAGNE